MNKNNSLKIKNSKILIILVTFLICILCTELGLHTIIYIADINMDVDRSLRIYFRDIEWGAAYLKELVEVFAEAKYVPFVEWQSNEHKGYYINIDQEGIRKTWNHKNIDKHSSKKIYIFGGSTIWGECARDFYTIPSHLAKILNMNGKNNFIVYNYGERAYVFKQEIIRLFLLLREGNRPDYVIFYDGSNDVYSAYQSGIPGTILDMTRIQQKLQSNSLQSILNTVTYMFQNRCYIYRAIYRLYGMLSNKNIQDSLSSYDENRIKILSAEIVRDYSSSMQILDQLARAYNFRYICLWQPVIFTEKMVNQNDALGELRINDQSLAKLYQYTNNLLKEKFLLNFYNLSDALSGRTERVYVDFVHLTEGGNEVMAKRISDILIKEDERRILQIQ